MGTTESIAVLVSLELYPTYRAFKGHIRHPRSGEVLIFTGSSSMQAQFPTAKGSTHDPLSGGFLGFRRVRIGCEFFLFKLVFVRLTRQMGNQVARGSNPPGRATFQLLVVCSPEWRPTVRTSCPASRDAIFCRINLPLYRFAVTSRITVTGPGPSRPRPGWRCFTDPPAAPHCLRSDPTIMFSQVR
jgi:hypothetical protein